ncbi:hypothetical protein AV942_17255 [Alteromonas mediterranea]|jgi:hypothetical protein|uniref:Uncharacterized protein n=1 Tax=Alteromonas mediterranea TaxID=314275 RepID=A0AAC9AE22_9ALTE|nr:hypothetical protein AV942_17255 [Alteromonas mediterranea]
MTHSSGEKNEHQEYKQKLIKRKKHINIRHKYRCLIRVLSLNLCSIFERSAVTLDIVTKRGSCKKIKNAANNDLIVNPLLYSYGLSIELAA